MTLRPVESGLAMLVLTELYPFVKTLPLIRYLTGDLVEVVPGACEVDPVAFAPKGRYARCLTDQAATQARVLLTQTELLDAVEETPEVLQAGPAMGEPRVAMRIERGSREIVVEFQSRFSSEYFAEAARAAEASLARRLRHASPSLRSALDEGYHLKVIATDREPPARSGS